VREAIAASPHTVVYRPPYTPTAAPSETNFHSMREWLRTFKRFLTNDNMPVMISKAIEQLSRDQTDLFHYCGYPASA
jgi:transposase